MEVARPLTIPLSSPDQRYVLGQELNALNKSQAAEVRALAESHANLRN